MLRSLQETNEEGLECLPESHLIVKEHSPSTRQTEANTNLLKLHDWPLLLDFLWQ